MVDTKTVSSLRNTTALGGGFHARLLEALGSQEKRDNAALGLVELHDILRGLEKSGHHLDEKKLKDAGKKDSLAFNKAFLDYLRETDDAAKKLKEQLEKLRDEAKKEPGYLQKAFSIFSHPKPLEKIVADVAAFDKYCRQNGITFDDVGRQLVAGPKPKTAFDHIRDFRFLISAAAGGAIGLAGVNLAGSVPALGLVTGAFFAGLPYLALPFITLSIFRAFSEKSVLGEIGTLARFGGVMAAGFAISLGVVSAMSGFLPTLDPATAGAATDFVTKFTGTIPFSPSQYILHGIGAGMALGTLYRATKLKMADGFAKAADAGKNTLSRAFNFASDVLINKYTSPFINAIGKTGEKLGKGIDKTFGHYMNFVGVPAVAILMSGALAGGIGTAFAAYGAYYATIFAGMGAAYATLAGVAYLRHGLRGREFGALAKVAGTALGTSSSAATMPVTKAGLKEIGVPDKIVNSVVPLGANFNMLGTSLYLGATAAAALVMFGAPLTIPLMATVGAVTVLTAFGAPGMPSSNIMLLDPVMQKTGLSPAQAAKIYEMVLPGDRILDMMQTSLNVLGDCAVALEVWRKEKKQAAAPKHEGQRWGDRLIGRFRPQRPVPQPAAAPVNDNQPAAETAAPEPKKAAPGGPKL